MLKERSRDNYFELNVLDPFMAGHNGFICGGCFKNLFNHEKIKDVDIFFQSKADWSNAQDYFNESEHFSFYYENDNVKAYKHNDTGIVVELCCTIFGTPETILNQFDFTITKAAYFKATVQDEDSNETHIEYQLLIHEDFFEHLHQNRLVIDDTIPYPMSTLERMFRYAKYGYFPCKETKLKIAHAIHDLREDQISVSNVLYNGMD